MIRRSEILSDEETPVYIEFTSSDILIAVLDGKGGNSLIINELVVGKFSLYIVSIILSLEGISRNTLINCRDNWPWGNPRNLSEWCILCAL